jgi:ATP-dependent DNA helicase
LGKTIQTVAFLTYLYAKGVKGPFLVVGPLSTLANWVKEIQKWAPAMPVLLYHGTKNERIELRKKALPAIISSKQGIVVTSFEITIKDRSALQRKRWKYIIVDEGHRMKNMNCRLVKVRLPPLPILLRERQANSERAWGEVTDRARVSSAQTFGGGVHAPVDGRRVFVRLALFCGGGQELKAYDSANRLLLTGTPLQNNLTELWSLLSFLMPSIFDDLDAFQRWFNFEGVGKEEGNKRILTAERENQLVTKLHTILKPFLLRRVKTDVEMDLPKKEERVINTILTPAQHKYYQAIMNKQLHELLATSKAKVRFQGTGLQNLLMQLRKCCNHPYLFEWPVDDKGEEVVDERLVETSGKLRMLDRLLPRLREEGHKVLLFSQMTRMLDILEDYMHLRQFSFFRIDGTTPQPERQAQIEDFNTGDGAFCFLLSTRAGGLGINLTAANVVVFVDSDWNPQMDLQAQDRAHRIGQTRNVRVYRLVTGNSIEAKIVERAAHKMKLGALVLAGAAQHTKKDASFQLDELSDLLHDSSLIQPLTEPSPTTDELLFEWD